MQVTGNNLNQHKSLSIRLCTDGFSFYVSSPEDFSFIPFSINPTVSLTANLKEAISQITALSEPYKNIYILVDSPSTILPFEFFEEEKVEQLYAFNYPHRKNYTVLYNILPKSNATLLFSIDKNAYQFLTEQFPHAYYYAVETPIIEHLVEKSRLSETQKLYVYFHGRTIHVYIFNNGKLFFANNFTYTDVNDALYFILQIWKNQGLNQFTDELHVLGDLPEEEKTLKELRRYIRCIYQNNPVTELNLKAEHANKDIPYDLQIITHRGI